MAINTASDTIQNKLLNLQAYKPHRVAGEIPITGQTGLQRLWRGLKVTFLTFGELKTKNCTELQAGEGD